MLCQEGKYCFQRMEKYTAYTILLPKKVLVRSGRDMQNDTISPDLRQGFQRVKNLALGVCP